MKRFISLVTLTSFTASFVALCAAIFSVTGIAKLFAGAALSAAIMASALELGKIVSISFLYQYWEKVPRTLKYYLTVASTILMIITSAGIYGYLSAAYAKVAATPLQLNADIETVKGQLITVEQNIQRKNERLTQLLTLRTQQENRLDNLIAKSSTGNSTAIKGAQTSLTQADKNVTDLQREIATLSTTRDSLNGLSISKKVAIETNSDIGTFVYIAKILNTDLDTVVKWFTLTIVLVFDPLAVALVIAVNFLIKTGESANTEQYTIYQDPVIEDPEPTAAAAIPPESEVVPVPQFTSPDFDWNNRELWESNPNAVHYYNSRINSRV